MRTLTYRLLPGVGDEELEEEGTLLQFVLNLPHLFVFGLIPTISVLNDIFQAGMDDAGMSGGCVWEPFAIEPQEHEELVQALQASPEADYRLVEPPEWVTSRSDWHIWTMKYEVGVPHEEYSMLSRENKTWDRLKAIAREAGNEELAMEYHLKGLEAGKRLSEFIEPYVVAHSAKKHHS